MLTAGAELVDRDYNIIKIEEVRCERTAGTKVYNFQVEGYHTYCVGEDGIWVHNAEYKTVSPELKGDIKKAENAQEKAKDLSSKNGYDDAPKKTVASDGKNNTVSGWKEQPEGSEFSNVSPQEVIDKSNEIGHSLKNAGAMDQGVPGQYNASHAEKKLSIISEDPIGISQPMCSDCQAYFSKLAQSNGKTYVAADPNKIWIFSPDGIIDFITR